MPAATEAGMMPQLHLWTGPSGTATYEKSVTVPAAGRFVLSFGEGTPVPETPRRNGMRAWLESPVREAAVVYVNGRRAGSVWAPPYELEISLHGGENKLRIVLANLAINAMASQPLPDYKALIAKYGRRFEPQDMDEVKPLPSGLLGPIKLMRE